MMMMMRERERERDERRERERDPCYQPDNNDILFFPHSKRNT